MLHLSLTEAVANYGYWAVFAIIALESAGMPLPGETALIAASVYAGTTSELDIKLVILGAAAGAILGDNVGFWVGRRFGFPFLLRFGSYIHLTEPRLKLGQYLFQRYGAKIVFFGRFTAFLRAFAAVLAGANRYPSRRFFVWNAAGGLAWALIIGAGGFACGHSFERIVGPAGLALLGFVVLGAGGLWLAFRRHEARLMQAAERAIPGPLGLTLT